MLARRSVPRALAVLASVALVATSCSNSESPTNKRPHTGAGTATLVNGVQQITITTGVDLRFHPSTITVHRGKVRVTLVNKTGSSTGPPHDLQVTGFPGASVPLVQADQTASSSTFMAPAPGSYKFVCTIHLAQGQTGTLVVKSGAAG